MKHTKLLLAGGLLIPTAHASAAVIDVTHTFDAAPFDQGNSLYYHNQGGISDVTIAEGDTLNLTFDFVGNQVVTMSNVQTLWAHMYVSQPWVWSAVTGTGSISLL